MADDFGDFDGEAVFDDHDLAAGDEFAVDAEFDGASADLSSCTTMPTLAGARRASAIGSSRVRR